MARKMKRNDEACSAIMCGDVGTIRRLLAEGLPVNELIDRNHTPLELAVSERQVAIVRVLIEAGADVNAGDGWTPLIRAAMEHHLPIVQALLAAGADVHRLDEDGCSALACATTNKSAAALKVVETLIAAGARGDAAALTLASESGSPAILRAVVAAGADVNEVSRWGTALIRAVDEKRQDNVEALLALGADVNLRVGSDHHNYPDKTALDVAREQKSRKLSALLEAAAAGTLPVASLSPSASADDVPALWKRIKKALPSDVKASLRKGATEKQLAALELALGVTLPPEFRASYRLVNGQNDEGDGLIPPEDFLDEGYLLLPLTGIFGEWKPWVELIEGGEFAGRTSSPDPGVRDDWWHRGWIPFASNGGGDSYCIDLAPAEGGTVGQVIAMNHETGSRPVLAKSFAEFLALLAQRLEDAAE